MRDEIVDRVVEESLDLHAGANQIWRLIDELESRYRSRQAAEALLECEEMVSIIYQLNDLPTWHWVSPAEAATTREKLTQELQQQFYELSARARRGDSDPLG